MCGSLRPRVYIYIYKICGSVYMYMALGFDGLS